MSEESEDFLSRRLNDIVTFEKVDSNCEEEAEPWKCWGRGGTRPSLSKLNFRRFVEVSKRNSIIQTGKLNIDCSNIMIPPVSPKDNSIMENIASECYAVFGDAPTDKHIADWLQQNFSEATDNINIDKHTKGNLQQSSKSCDFIKGTNKNAHLTNSVPDKDIADRTEGRTDISSNNLYESNLPINTNVQDENTLSQTFVLKRNSIDHVYNDTTHKASHQSCSSLDKLPPGLTSSDRKAIRCFPNRNQTFTIENLPNHVTRNELKQVLDFFGIVENIVIRESEGNTMAIVRMAAECNCPWIIGCLNGSQPFGGSNA